MIIEHANQCECGCERRAHANGLWNCRYHRDSCREFRMRRSQVPDIFGDETREHVHRTEDDDEQAD